MAEHHHRRLDLGVVVRVVAGEQRDAAPVQRLEARGRVGDALPDDPRDDPGEQPDPDPPRSRRAVAAFLRRRSASRRRCRPRRAAPARGSARAARVVLPVAVDADGDVVAVLVREAEAGLHGAADAEVERQPEDDRALRRRDLGRAVDRAVVDDDDVETGIERAQLVDHARDGLLLVQRRDDGDAAQLREPGESGRGGRQLDGLRHGPPPERRHRAARAAAVRGARTCARRARARVRGGRSPPPARDRRAAPGTPRSPRPRPRRRSARAPARTTARSPRAGSRRSRRRTTRARTGGTSTSRERRVRAAREVQVDPRRGDRTRKDVERGVDDRAPRRRRRGSRGRRARSPRRAAGGSARRRARASTRA